METPPESGAPSFELPELPVEACAAGDDWTGVTDTGVTEGVIDIGVTDTGVTDAGVTEAGEYLAWFQS